MSAQDPRNKFKTDNYEKQEQEVPGIQAKMSPQPDCGEDSYHGHEVHVVLFYGYIRL